MCILVMIFKDLLEDKLQGAASGGIKFTCDFPLGAASGTFTDSVGSEKLNAPIGSSGSCAKYLMVSISEAKGAHVPVNH